eukprot:gene25992-31386_t
MDKSKAKTPEKSKIDLELLDVGGHKVTPKLKPVFMDVHLEFHETLINKVGKTLAKTKKQLHETELILNLEPSLDDKIEHRAWQKKLNKRLSQRINMEFPTLLQLKKEHAMKKFSKSQETKSKEKVITKEEYMEKANRILAKQTHDLQQKVLNGKFQFGGSVKGEVLRTIPNYNGGNTYHKESRTLIRKDGTSMPSPTETSLPPWFGPGYYDPQPQPSTTQKSDNFYKMPFKSVPRKPPVGSPDNTNSGGVSPIRESKSRSNRRKQALSPLPPSTNSPPSSSSPPAGRGSPPVASFPSIFDLHDFPAGNEGEEDGKLIAGDIDNAKQDGGDVQFRPKRNRDSFSQVSRRSFSQASSQPSYPTASSPLVVLSRDPSVVLQDSTDSSELTPLAFVTSSPPRPISRHISSPQGKMRSRKRASVVLNPVHDKYSGILKTLNSEDPAHNKWKIKDYTRGALAAQLPLVLHSCDLEPLESANETRPGTSQSNHEVQAQLDLMSRPATGTKLKYSSDIFRIKKIAYRSSEQLLVKAKVSHSSAMTPEASSRKQSVMGNSSSGFGGLGLGIGGGGTGSRRMSLMSAGGLSRGSVPSRPASRPTRIVPSVQSNANSNSQSTMPSYIQNGDSTPDNANVTQTNENEGSDDEDNDDDIMQLGGLLRGLDTVDEYSMTNSQGSMHLPFVVPPRNESIGAAIKDWCAVREVHRFHPSRKVIRDTFLVEHKELPSVDFALQGLLLDENPYTKDDPLIKGNEDRDVGDINVYV